MNKNQNGKYRLDAETFWNNVDVVRRERQMSWKELSQRVGLTQKSLSTKKITKCNPSLGSAREFADALGTSIDRLVYAGRMEENTETTSNFT